MKRLEFEYKPSIDELCGETEIIWQSTNNINQFTKIKENYEIKNSMRNYLIKIGLPNGSNQIIEVVCDKNKYLEELSEKFNVIKEATNQQALFKISFHDSGVDLKNYGFLSYKDKEAYIYGHGFGILKSAIVAFSTYLENSSLPIHASVINTNIGGFAFSGGNKKGKTTIVYNLFDLLENQGFEPSIICDDRCGINETGKIRTPDPTLSLRKQQYKTNQKLFDTLTHEQRIINDKRKIAIKLPGTIYNPKNVTSTQIKALFCLGDEIKNVGSFLVGSAYHYPYLFDTKMLHSEKRYNLLAKNKIPIYQYDTSNTSIEDGCDNLLEIISSLSF